MAKLNNKIGPPVEGDDFFGREREVSRGWDDLMNGNHLLIVAPRRVGKSSFAKRLIFESNENKWKGAYVDVQEVTNEIGFFEVFFETLQLASKSWLGKGMDKVMDAFSSVLDKVRIDWESDAGKFSFGLTSSQQNALKESVGEILTKVGKMLIVVDELPYFLARIESTENGKQRVSDFLHLLRSIRQKSGNQVAWIYCGSIGLDAFVGRHGLTSTLNDLLPFDIAAFDDETARLFLNKLAKDNKVPLTDKNISEILDLIGWPLPYFLQAHFGQLRRLSDLGQKKIDSTLIRKAYTNLVQSVLALKTWDERLNAQIPEHADFCRRILKNLCSYNSGLSRAKLVDMLFKAGNNIDKFEKDLGLCLSMLVHDGYLIVASEHYAFRSPLLRDFWYENYIK